MAEEKTPEQLAEEARLAAEAAAQKEADKAAKKAEKDAQKLAEKEQRDAKKAADKAAKEEEARLKKEARAAAKVERNGVSRPMTGVTKQVWDLADAISAELREPAPRAKVIEQGKAAGIQEGTINTQYGRWRKYNGLTTERAPKQPAAPETPETPAE